MIGQQCEEMREGLALPDSRNTLCARRPRSGRAMGIEAADVRQAIEIL